MKEAQRIIHKVATELLNRKWDAEDGKIANYEMEQWAHQLFQAAQYLANHQCEDREDA